MADEVARLKENLDQATRRLRLAIQSVEKLKGKETWQRRSDDLGLLAEQIVDIRQQILLLELELGLDDGPHPRHGHEVDRA